MRKFIAFLILSVFCLALIACQNKSENLENFIISDGMYFYYDENHEIGASFHVDRINKEVYERAYKDKDYLTAIIYDEKGETVYISINIYLNVDGESYDLNFQNAKQSGNVFTSNDIHTRLEGAKKLTLKFTDEDGDGTFEHLGLKLTVTDAKDIIFTMENHNSDLNTLYPDLVINSADEIEKVTVTTYPGSIVPPWINEVWNVTDREYFQKIVDFVQSNPKFVQGPPSYGGGGTSYKVTMKSGKVYWIPTGQVEVNGLNYFCQESLSHPARDPDEYFIDVPSRKIEYISYGESTSLDSSFLNDIRYVRSDRELGYVDLTKDAFFDLYGAYVTVVSAREFCFRGALWQVVSEADYTDYLPTVEDETCFLTVESEDGTTSYKVLVSKNQTYVADDLLQGLNLHASYFTFENGERFISSVITEDTKLIYKFK